MNPKWTEPRVEKLKQLLSDGLSSSQIADELGGVSRNSVIGKIHRLKLDRPTKEYSQQTPKQNFNRWVKKPAEPACDIIPFVETIFTIPNDNNCSLLELTNSKCKWPIGDPRNADFCFCGNRPFGNLPYCGPHAQLAYEARRSRASR